MANLGLVGVAWAPTNLVTADFAGLTGQTFDVVLTVQNSGSKEGSIGTVKVRGFHSRACQRGFFLASCQSIHATKPACCAGACVTASTTRKDGA
jgi:hypothetical protein